jgi:hypothetical protein
MLIVDGPVRLELKAAPREELEAALNRVRGIVGMYLSQLPKEPPTPAPASKFPGFTNTEYR